MAGRQEATGEEEEAVEQELEVEAVVKTDGGGGRRRTWLRRRSRLWRIGRLSLPRAPNSFGCGARAVLLRVWGHTVDPSVYRFSGPPALESYFCGQPEARFVCPRVPSFF